MPFATSSISVRQRPRAWTALRILLRARTAEMARRALVTGGAGFIGSHVADILIANDHAVTVVDNLSSGKRSQVPSGAAYQELDISAPEAAALVREGKFDVISHLAAQIDVRKSVADPAADAMLNIGGSLNLLEAVRQSGRATRFVFSSTGGAVYGDLVEAPTAEDAPKDVSGVSSELVHAPARAGEQRRSAVRIEMAGKVLGWKPKKSLKDGLRETYQWFAGRRAG